MFFNQLSRLRAYFTRPVALYSKRYTFAGALAALLLLIQSARAAQPSETEIKLVYLYNFTKFVSWPAEAFDSTSAPFRLCMFGDQPIQELIASLRTKTTDGRKFEVLFPKQLTDISTCHIAFLHRISTTMTKRIVRTAPTSSTLLVSDLAGFASDTGIIEFVVDEQNRVRIKVNLSNANKRKLTISAKLLETAIHTYRDPE